MGDFNNDGLLDISAGSVWYEHPAKPDDAWKMHVLGEKPNEFDIKTYGDTFMNWAEDLDGDGRQDLIVVDFPGKQTWWFQNPGHASKEPWKRHVVVPVRPTTKARSIVDVDGDGQRELIYGDAANRLSLARPQANPLAGMESDTRSPPPGDVEDREVLSRPRRRRHQQGRPQRHRRPQRLVGRPLRSNTDEPWTFHAAPFGPAAGPDVRLRLRRRRRQRRRRLLGPPPRHLVVRAGRRQLDSSTRSTTRSPRRTP